MGLKVKIVKCSSKDYWYKNRIGEIFKVSKSPVIYGNIDGIEKYVWICSDDMGILKEDCEVIRENKTKET